MHVIVMSVHVSMNCREKKLCLILETLWLHIWRKIQVNIQTHPLFLRADSWNGPFFPITASIYWRVCKCREMKHRTFQAKNNYLFCRVGPFITYNVMEWLWKTYRGGDSNEFHLWGSQRSAAASEVEIFQILFKFQTGLRGEAPLSRWMQLLWWICSGKICFYHVYSNVYFNFFHLREQVALLLSVCVSVFSPCGWIVGELRQVEGICYLMNTASDAAAHGRLWKPPHECGRKLIRKYEGNRKDVKKCTRLWLNLKRGDSFTRTDDINRSYLEQKDSVFKVSLSMMCVTNICIS